MGMGFLARNFVGHVLASYYATKPYIVDLSIGPILLIQVL